MAKIRQLRLPSLKVERVVSEKFPQPRNILTNLPKKFELLHHPFDLKFRGRLNKWLVALQDSEDVKLEEVLEKESVAVIKLYFFPQGTKKKWLNQEEVLKRTKIPYEKKLRKKLVESLLLIWRGRKLQ
ncbi:hypothetical protein KKB40_05785 [Patescibacteria group bacterium]|nr:hypothetical protein [Patescibacteria group bacterium]